MNVRLALLFVLAWVVAGCCPRATVRPNLDQPPALVNLPACSLTRPPAIPGYPSRCSPHVCLSDADAHALAAEIRALDGWARAAFASCPHEPPNRARVTPAP